MAADESNKYMYILHTPGLTEFNVIFIQVTSITISYTINSPTLPHIVISILFILWSVNLY